MTVSNNQPADETTFNNAFVSRTSDSNTTGKVDLENTEPASGGSVINAQRELNGLNSYTGSSVNDDEDRLPLWSNTSVGSATDNLTERVEALTVEFDPASGHTHDGVDSPLIDATGLDNVRLKGSFVRATDLVAVTGSSVVVTTQMTGKTASAGSTSEGVVVTDGLNNVILKDDTAATEGDQLKDANGDLIYGRITEASGAWTLSFYKNVAGVQTAHSFTAQSIQWFYQELFNPLTTAPVYSELAAIPSDNATQDVIDATSSLRGLVSATAQTFGGVKSFAAGVKAQAYLATERQDVASAATITALSSTKSFVKLTGATATELQGITAGVDGQTLTLHNGTDQTLTVAHEDAGATAANRIVLAGGLDVTVEAGASVEFIYDTNQSRWVQKSGSGSGSGGDNAFLSDSGMPTMASGEVVWDNLTNMTAVNSQLTKTTAIGWNAVAWSNSGFTGSGYIEFQAPADVTNDAMIGLADMPTVTSPTFNTIDFAIYIENNTAFRVYESGTLKYSSSGHSSSDTWRVESDGATVVYKRNGTTFYTSAVSPVGLTLQPTAAGYRTSIVVSNAYLNTGGTASGNEDDHYLDTSNGDLYKRGPSDWSLLGNFDFLEDGAAPRAFRAVNTSGAPNITSSGVDVTFPTEAYDHGSNFASPNFTAPANGLYAFEWAVTSASVALATNEHFTSRLVVDGVDVARGSRTIGSGSSVLHGSAGSASIYLTAGQVVKVIAVSSQTVALSTAAGDNFFSGYLVREF